MIVLGITHPISWSTGACLLIDGKLVAMVEEERLNRIKFAPRIFPSLSIQWCLDYAGITLDQVDYVGVGFERPWDTIWPNIVADQPFYYKVLAAGYMALHNTSNMFKIPAEIRRKNPIFVNHHVSHANSVFYCSQFDEANVISLDGTGGSNAGLIGHAHDTKLDIFRTVANSDSWGNMYAQITKLLGFKPHQDEYKVMGLASFGNPDPKLLPFINWDGEIPVIDRKRYRDYRAWMTQTVDTKEPMNQHSQDIAATCQATYEKVTERMLEFLIKKTGSRNLCMSGGSALNCTNNGKLIRSGLVDEIAVQPASWDAGTALGAAIQVHIDKTGKRPEVGFDHAYWGPEFGNDQIEKAIKEHGGVRNWRRSDDVCKETAKLLAENKVIGWYQGRQEVGPRALGNRSILGNPKNPEMKDLINMKVKGREPWRPFAPSILEEYAAEYMEGYSPSPYMLMTFMAKADKRDEIISATHVDGTCRPQAVSKRTNPRYWTLIDEFRQLTGVPVVLNTSFNLSDEPNVCTPQNALETFYRCGLDCLVMGDFIIEKTKDDYCGAPKLRK